MCCVSSIVKIVLFVANILFLAAGGVLLAIGILYVVGYDKITDVIPEEYNLDVAPTATIVIGSIIFVIAFLGCCGAIKENRCLLITYGIILLLLLIAQIAIGVVALLAIRDSDDGFKGAVTNATQTLFDKYDSGNSDVDSTVDYIQQEFECCGVNGPSDWSTIPKPIPNSCCEEDTCTSSNAYQDGCAQKLFDFFEKSVTVVGWVAIGVVVTEILGMIFAWGLSSSIRKERGYY